jgi:ABC-type hemin transport system substrate-binding protein
MGKIEERTKLGARWAELFDEKAAIEAEAFTRWEEGFKGLTVEQTRTRYFTKRIFTAEEQASIDSIVARIENIGETLKVLDEKIYVIKSNVLRRQLTDYQKVELAKPLEDLIAEKARQRMSDGGKGSPNGDTLLTVKEVSKAIGVPVRTYQRAKKIRDEGTPEEQASIDSIVARIENIGETLKVFDEAIHRDVDKTRHVEPIESFPDQEYRSKW